jgi:hypothetical protein
MKVWTTLKPWILGGFTGIVLSWAGFHFSDWKYWVSLVGIAVIGNIPTSEERN